MAYHFSRDDKSVQAAVHRLALEQIEGALADTRDPARAHAAAIHSARKRVKKLRGLLRLVQPVLDGSRQESAVLRDATRHIAGLRDAEVRLRTFDTLVAPLPASAGLAALREGLGARVATAREPVALAESLAAFREGLHEVHGRVPGWHISGRGFEALEGGLADTWRRARRGLKTSRAAFAGDFDATPFHDWRRPVKDHWYQARLLTPVWPAMMAAHVAATDELGELLGDHNDLDVLTAQLSGTVTGAGGEALPAVAALALDRRRALAGRALALGTRLFAGRADDLTARWGIWWEVWQSRGNGNGNGG